MKVLVEGHTTISGNPVAFLSIMQDARFFDQLTGDEYIESVKEIAQRCFGADLKVQGSTYEERAESLLREMAAHNMIKIEEEE